MTQVESPDTSGAVLTACTILLSIETSRTVILRANIGMVRASILAWAWKGADAVDVVGVAGAVDGARLC